jgi:acyl-coenzyme A synthetase/AMP-(fatty) acid ligase
MSSTADGATTILKSGMWCSQFELESTLSEHPSVLETAVVECADVDGHVKHAAWVVLKTDVDDAAALEAELVMHCKARLAPFKFPHWFHFVPELPKTATGMVLRYKLRAGQAREAAPVHSGEIS